jgi:hypothetical protein
VRRLLLPLWLYLLWFGVSRQAGPRTYRKDYPKGGHGYYLDGAYLKGRGVTTIISNGTPSRGLIQWAANSAADYAVDHAEALVALGDPDGFRELCRTAHTRDRDKAARRGTEVHALAQRLMAGEEVEVPDELEGHVDSYIRFVEEWKPGPETLIERTVVSRKHRYMGTFDAVGTLLGMPGPGLYDIKTTRSGIFGDIALQFAGYRYAETMLSPDMREEEPMPEINWCAALWVRADGYDLIPVEAGEREFRAFLYVDQVGQFMDRCTDLIGQPLNPYERTTP